MSKSKGGWSGGGGGGGLIRLLKNKKVEEGLESKEPLDLPCNMH